MIPSFYSSFSEIEVAASDALMALLRMLFKVGEPEEVLGCFLNSILPLFQGWAYAACSRAGSGDVLRYIDIGPNEDSWSDENVKIGEEVCLGSVPCGLALEADEFIQKKFSKGLILEIPIRQRDNIVLVMSILLSEDCASEVKSLASETIRKAAELIEEFLGMRLRLAEKIDRDNGRLINAIDSNLSESPVSWCGIVGNSDVMQEMFSMINQVADTEATVLLLGESGTGKELVAKAIHQKSSRASKPFVAVNCAALPESVIESELFGHEKGAYTGAFEQRKGRFEQANEGTLFLDEIGELSPALQIKLLRFLQDHRFERVGGNANIEADVRVIAATNRNLQEAVDQGSFRADLYYRLNVFPINVPPLRERGADILLLADHFVSQFNRENSKKIQRISTPALDLLMIYHWPGNVRELENCILRAAILSTDGVIHAYHLPPSLQSAASTGTEPKTGLDAEIFRLEKELIIEALKLENGNVAAAARRLMVTERRIRYAIQRHRIDPRRFKTKF